MTLWWLRACLALRGRDVVAVVQFQRDCLVVWLYWASDLYNPFDAFCIGSWFGWYCQGHVANMPALVATIRQAVGQEHHIALVGVVQQVQLQAIFFQQVLFAAHTGLLLSMVAVPEFTLEQPCLVDLIAQRNLLAERFPVSWCYGWRYWIGVWGFLLALGLFAVAGLQHSLPEHVSGQKKLQLAQEVASLHSFMERAAMLKTSLRQAQEAGAKGKNVWLFLERLGTFVPHTAYITQLSWSHQTPGSDAHQAAAVLSMAGNATSLEAITNILQALQNSELVRFIQLEKLVCQNAELQHFTFLVKIALT